MKIEESLNVTFDKTPPPSKTLPLVDDDLDDEEAIKVTGKKNLENDIEDETLEVDEIINIKESKNHPLDNIIGNINQRTLRLVAQSYNQQEEIDYDETYASVARLESIRILLAYDCALDFKLSQMDVKSVFLNGFINEEVYVAQTPGFIDFKKPNRVYKLKKALYGLKQAPKAWSGCLPLHFLSLEVDLVKTYRIPQDLHPRLPDPRFTMDRLLGDAIGIYTEFLWFFGVRLNKVVSFEVEYRDLDIVPTITLFRVFQCLCKQRDWFSFSKCRNTEDVCTDNGPSSLKNMPFRTMRLHTLVGDRCDDCLKSVSHAVVSPPGEHDLSTDGYDWNDVERLCARLIRHEMKEEVLIRSGLSSVWFNKDVIWFFKGLMTMLIMFHRTLLCRKRKVPTADEIAASLPDPRLAKKLKGLFQDRVRSSSDNTPKPSQELKRRKLRKRASEPSSSAPELCTFVRAAWAPYHVLVRDWVLFPLWLMLVLLDHPLLGLRSMLLLSDVTFLLELDLLDSLARSALARDAEYDQILDDDFSTATLGEEIDLTLFPLTPGPYHTPYPYEGVSSPLYTKKEWDGPHVPKSNSLCKDIFKDLDVYRKALDRTITLAELRRTESLLPLELSNRVNVLSALLVSHGYELNSPYTNLVSSKALLQEKLNQKKGDARLLHLEVTSLDDKLEKLQRDYDALGQENRELCLTEELTRTAAKLSEQALTVRDLQNELALERSKSQGYKNSANELRAKIAHFIGSGVEGLVRKLLSSDEFHAALTHVTSLGISAKADFDKALVGFPTTLFPFLGKVVTEAGGTLFDVDHIFPDKFTRSSTSVSAVPSDVNEAPDQVPL
ncbi:retrovirus-related pol polyprotein from transposon TNT 1-94 [Tanacetum coccineum]